MQQQTEQTEIQRGKDGRDTKTTKSKRIRRKKVQVEHKETEEWPGCKKAEIHHAMCAIQVTGREKEVEHIVSFVLDDSASVLYIYGMPGSGKTHVVRKVCETAAEHGMEVYYTNYVMDNEFMPVSTSNSRTSTVLLAVDEYEGHKKEKRYIKCIEKLKKKWTKQGRNTAEMQCVYIKTLLISNAKVKDGLHFVPYKKAEIQRIVEKQEEEHKEEHKDIETDKTDSSTSMQRKHEHIKRIHEAVERADLRVALHKKIEVKHNGSTHDVFGQYHKFVARKIASGETDTNTLYRQFIAEMKRKQITVIPKELFQDIVSMYTDGMA